MKNAHITFIIEHCQHIFITYNSGCFDSIRVGQLTSMENIIIMSFFTKGDFKTREEWLKRQKRATLKKQEQKYNKAVKCSQKQLLPQQPKKEKLNQILTLDTQQSIPSQTPPPKQEVNISAFKSETDANLFKTMQVRLREQEQLQSQQRSQISELSRLIQQAKTENTILKAVDSDTPSFEQSENIRNQNNELRKRFAEMEAYLNANGAFYEGSTIVGEFNVNKVKKDIKQSKTNYRTPSGFEFSAIEQRVYELNQNLMKQFGSKQIVNAHGVNKFKECQKIKVEFYKNGVNFEGRGFYNYSKKEGLKILQDLSEGYYPHILKKPFPDGVIMNLQNKLSEIWEEEKGSPSPNKDWFFGKGHALDCD